MVFWNLSSIFLQYIQFIYSLEEFCYIWISLKNLVKKIISSVGV